jgi:hypothetical protein
MHLAAGIGEARTQFEQEAQDAPDGAPRIGRTRLRFPKLGQQHQALAQGNSPTACWTIAASGQASAKHVGRSGWSAITFVPRPCSAYQYSSTSSRLTASTATLPGRVDAGLEFRQPVGVGGRRPTEGPRRIRNVVAGGTAAHATTSGSQASSGSMIQRRTMTRPSVGIPSSRN